MADAGGWPRRSRQPVEDLRFVVVGAYVVDCFVVTPRIPYWGEEYEARSVRTSPGGKALNQAVALARLGARVAAVGVVGADGVGRDILTALTREGVDTIAVEERRDVSTAVCVCLVGDDGRNSVVWHIDDDVAITPETVRAAVAAIRTADAVLITFEMPTESIRAAISATRETEAMVIIQPAPQLASPAAAASLPWHLTDVVVANEAEARALLSSNHGAETLPVDDLVSALALQLSVPMVVVTLGEAGCLVHAEGSVHRYPAETVTAVDVTGAGDAFTANLVAGLVAGATTPGAVHAAQSAAAWTVRHAGGYEAMPAVSMPPSSQSMQHCAPPTSDDDQKKGYDYAGKE